jgi:putative ABC transport system substrate-binding protein
MHFHRWKRREVITLLGGAAAWPGAAHAQQRGMPVIGFLDARSPGTIEIYLRGFRQGLREIGYVEGENITVEYRWANNQLDRLPVLAAELVHQQVAVMAAFGTAALAAKAATATIPIVFGVGEDPVRLGLVAGLARPGGNVTGISFLNTELVAKRLELLHELVPAATSVAVLINPTFAVNAETILRDVETAARTRGLRTQVLNASTSREINAAFASFVHERPHALFVGGDPFLTSRRVQLVQLATLYKVPATYSGRQFPEVGGLMSYGANVADAYRQVGLYVAASSRVRGLRICRWCRRPSSSWSSMLRLPRCSVSLCRPRCLPPPTR